MRKKKKHNKNERTNERKKERKKEIQCFMFLRQKKNKENINSVLSINK